MRTIALSVLVALGLSSVTLAGEKTDTKSEPPALTWTLSVKSFSPK